MNIQETIKFSNEIAKDLKKIRQKYNNELEKLIEQYDTEISGYLTGVLISKANTYTPSCFGSISQ